MSVRTEISKLLANLIPTKTRVIVRGKQEPPSSAHAMDVDVLHGYLRSAESGDCTQLFGLYRDILASHSHTQAEFNKRKLAVLGDPLILTSQNPEDAVAVARDAAVQAHLVDRPGWVQWLSHKLDSTMYPVSLSERSYKVSGRPGWRYELAELRPVPHIHLAWPYGVFSIKETDDDGNFLGTYREPHTRTHIVHTGHLLSSVPDWWGGPMRALVFWWLFATMDRDWWARFLDRFGSPFLVGKYPEADEGAKYSLQDAFSSATRLFGLAITSDTEVEMHEANSQGGGEAFEKFYSVANREISKLIVGQTSSSEIQNAGLGGGQGTAQAEVRADIRRYDAFALGHTIRTQILAPLWRLNGWTTPVPNLSFGALAADEADLTGDLVSSLYSAGIELSDDGLQKLSSRLGLGLRRLSAGVPAVALSAQPRLPLLPTVARRAARQRLARGAVDALVADSSPRLARLMTSRSQEIADAIESADSPEAAAAAVASLAASYDPGTAADLVSRILSSASVNAVLAMD
jgi:phage gp29-like protein